MAVKAARELEAAKKANSNMNIVAAPGVQSAALAISGTDPISLMNWIASFLKTLEKFNVIADQIATVSVSPSVSFFDAHPMSRFIHTCKQHGLSSLPFPRSGRRASLVIQSNLRVADNH